MAVGLKPFGENSCEEEKAKLGDLYADYFFEEAPFNRPSLRPETYLIVGRRGSGKTSLSEYFGFQDDYPDARCIDVNEPNAYNAVLNRVVRSLEHPPELAIPMIAEVWEYTIWLLVFRALRDRDKSIATAARLGGDLGGSPSALVRSLFTGLMTKYLGSDEVEISAHIRDMVNRKSFQKAKAAVLEIVPREPVFIAVDSMDHYSLTDDAVMWSTAALVQKAAELNARYSQKGIHVKVFLTDEIFPYFQESVCNNPSKYIKDPLFLHWRPKDLARLVCWRFYKFLRELNGDAPEDVDWGRYDDVIKKVWIPHFGVTLENRNGVRENTFPYVLRHTQMRPRQLVILCNEIGRVAQEQGTFPDVPPEILIAAVEKKELALANEVVNSYSKIYENAGEIIGALSGIGMQFRGKELDRVAPRTASFWPDGSYTPSRFKRLVTELGIVGRKRGDREQGILEADFEFLLEDRLYLNESDTCVIHPMFYRKLNTRRQEDVCIYPFPDHPDFEGLRQDH